MYNSVYISDPISQFSFLPHCLVTKSYFTLCNPTDCSMPGFPVFYHLQQFAQTHVHFILCHPLLLLPSIFPSFRILSNESALSIRWPKYWSFSFSISPSGLISFRLDCSALLAVEGTLKSLLLHHNLKASILWHSAFFMVQFSCLYLTTGKTIAVPIRTFAGKVMSLIFNMLSRLVMTFLPRKGNFNFFAAITICSDFGARKNKVSHCFHCFCIYLP